MGEECKGGNSAPEPGAATRWRQGKKGPLNVCARGAGGVAKMKGGKDMASNATHHRQPKAERRRSATFPLSGGGPCSGVKLAVVLFVKNIEHPIEYLKIDILGL